MKVQIKRAGPAVSVRSRGASSARLKFTPGVPGPATEWRINEATNRFEYRPQRSDGAWTVATGSDFAGLIGGLTPEQLTYSDEATYTPNSVGGVLREFKNLTPEQLTYSDEATYSANSVGGMLREFKTRSKDVVNVRDPQFGAKGDGIADDTAAINAAIEYIRTRPLIAGRRTYHLVFPNGAYRVTGSINLTRLTTLDCVVDGCGSVILGECSGKPVVDAFGSRWLRVRDLRIVGDATNTPSFGWQMAKTSADEAADNNHFDNVYFTGRYSFAAVYNFCCETTLFGRLYVDNSAVPDLPSVKPAYGVVQDGLNMFGVTSEFAPQTSPANTNGSFNENLYLNADIRCTGGGTPIFMADTRRHRFISSYAASTSGPIGMVLWAGPQGHRGLDLDLHFEREDGLVSCIQFAGADVQTVYGFKWRDQEPGCTGPLFATRDNVQFVTLADAQLEWPTLGYMVPTVFDSPAKFLVSGSVYLPQSMAAKWNRPRAFSGHLRFGQGIIPVNMGMYRYLQGNDQPQQLTRDGQPPGTNNNLDPLVDNTARAYRGHIIGRNTGTGDTATWSFEATIKRGVGAAATQLVGTPTVTKLAGDTATSPWIASITADTTNGALGIVVQGPGVPIRWMVSTEYTEVAA
jgi:hypothetical protein